MFCTPRQSVADTGWAGLRPRDPARVVYQQGRSRIDGGPDLVDAPRLVRNERVLEKIPLMVELRDFMYRMWDRLFRLTYPGNILSCKITGVLALENVAM